MRIQPTIPNFQGRVNIKTLKSIAPVEAGEFAANSSLLGSLTGTVSATSTVGSVPTSLGGASDVIGSAFIAKASGVNSSGIVPSVIEVATPHVTPETVASLHNHPSLIGSFFSTVGSFFSELGSYAKNVKNPS